MLIHKLRQHFPARLPEWTNAGIMIAWGAYVILHPGLFGHPDLRQMYAGLKALYVFPFPIESAWGLVMLALGGLRGCALFINGAYSRTPIIRLVTSALSAFLWAQIVAGILNSGIPNVDLVVYAGLVFMDVASAYRAAKDTTFAERNRSEAKKGTVGRGRNFAGYSL